MYSVARLYMEKNSESDVAMGLGPGKLEGCCVIDTGIHTIKLAMPNARA